MRLRLSWLCCVFCLGCHAASGLDVGKDFLWEKGQEAMRAGRPDEAIAYYRQGLKMDPAASHNYLSLAAALVAKGDEVGACEALSRFVTENPVHRNGRHYYAELARKLGKRQEAAAQFERLIADLQDDAKLDHAQLCHCHGRLMEMAEGQEDDYDYRLHRGIGLYWLAQGSLSAGGDTAELPPEGLLCKAANELTEARISRPGEARPAWYLHLVWRALGQASQAQPCLRDALEAAPFTYLTPSELRSLQLESSRQSAAAVGSRRQ